MSILNIHTHTSSPDAFFVNSFIIEGERSLILVDTQFVLSEANAIVGKLAELHKPLAGIFITHPHPDHYNGLATILTKYSGTAVYGTADTIAGIRETAEPKRAYWTPIVGANYPQTFAFPNVTVRDGQHISIDGINLQIFDLGPSECQDNTIIALPQIDAAIISDLVYNRVHPWLAEGRSAKWLDALDAARDKLIGVSELYPGHGIAGSPAIIGEQSAYISTVRELVADAMKAEGRISASEKKALIAKIEALYPNWPLSKITGMNVDGIVDELASM